MRCGSYPIFISFTFFSSTLGPTSNTTLFPPPNLIFEVHWSSHILIAQHTQITNVHLSIYKSQFLWIYFIQCSPWYLFNTIYYRHHYSFFVSNCNTNCKRSVDIQLRKEGGLPKWFPPAKNETHMRPLPIYWFDGIMFLLFAMWFVGQIDDWLTFWILWLLYPNSMKQSIFQKGFWYNDWSFTIFRNDKIISKSKNQTVSQISFQLITLQYSNNEKSK